MHNADYKRLLGNLYNEQEGKMHFGNLNKDISFFLEHLADGPGNELTIYITQAKKIDSNSESIITEFKAESNKRLQDILAGCVEIVPDYAHSYKIHFDNYIIYQVRNESYCSYDYGETRYGYGLILFNKSNLLDYLNQSTNAFDNGDDVYLAKFQHYGVYTYDHIIDVISHNQPTIENIELQKNNQIL